MMLTISQAAFFNTIVLVGAIQGFIISSLLFFTKKNRYSNRILAALIFFIALAGFNLYGTYANWFNSDLLHLIALLIPFVIVMPLGPLIYFYVLSLSGSGFKIGKKERRYFWSVLIDLVPQFTVYIYMACKMLNVKINNTAAWGIFIDDYNVYADIPRWMSITFYIWLSAKYLRANKINNDDRLNAAAENLKWLKQFILIFMIFQAIWLIYLIPYVIPRYTDWMLNTFDWYPLYIPLAIIIYWLGIKGYIVSYQQTSADKKLQVNNSGLSVQLVKQVIGSLTKAMDDEKIYLNPNLTVAMMAQHTGFAQKIISAVLNQHLQKGFSEFVNGYRVTAFKKQILLPETNNLTIAGIALECGFSSQATFQRIFKEITGQSPTEFRKAATLTD
jgi:AraC-like DNA-binding protein/putative Ca2+/H+ antiporter (TMEM165/GDT1 family)